MRVMFGVFLDHSSLYFLRQAGLLLSPELPIGVSVVNQLCLGTVRAGMLADITPGIYKASGH